MATEQSSHATTMDQDTAVDTTDVDNSESNTVSNITHGDNEHGTSSEGSQSNDNTNPNTSGEAIERGEPASTSLITAYILWLFTGLFGGHRMYLFGCDDEITQIYMATLSYFGIGWIMDLFLLPYLHYQANERLKWEHEHNQPSLCYRNYIEPYAMHLSPLFFYFGFHKIYLDRHKRQSAIYYLFYFFTLGFFGIGWLVDLLRMPFLVKEANKYIRRQRQGEDYAKICEEANFDMIDLRLCTLTGFFGAHYFYLKRATWGFAYLATFGLYGFGWLYDLLWWPRLSKLLEEANRGRLALKNWDETFLVTGDFQKLEAYLLALPPFGIFGLYHFYLHRYRMGFLYLCTAGLLGIGWLVDLFRMDNLVQDARRKRQEELNRKDPNEDTGPTPLEQMRGWAVQAAAALE